MSELTKEYFDQGLKNLVTKKDLSDQIAGQTTELKAYAREQTKELARMVAGGFEDLHRRFDMRELVQSHER